MTDAINTYDQLRMAHTLGLPPVAITGVCSQGRAQYFIGASVWHLTKPADPSNKDYCNRGMKIFHAFDEKGLTSSERKKAVFERAKAWASEKYGIAEWERNRWRDFVPAPLNSKFPLRK